MTDIIKQNTAIANFMGLIVIPAGTKAIGEIKHPEVSEAFLKYNTSWDALMPVIEKISKIPLMDGNIPCTDPIDTCYPLTFNMPTDEGGNVMFRFKGSFINYATTLIEAAYNAVVEFIKYHSK